MKIRTMKTLKNGHHLHCPLLDCLQFKTKGYFQEQHHTMCEFLLKANIFARMLAMFGWASTMSILQE